MGTWPLWIAFNAGVALLLLLDLGLFHRRAHVIHLREAAIESAAWVALSLGFGAWIFISHGRGPGLEFFTGYVVEKSLSLDNVFVFLLVFQYFRVDPRYQHRLLFWGVLGALVLRGAMVGAGAALIARFDWVLYLFGAFLAVLGIQAVWRRPCRASREKSAGALGAKDFCPCRDTEAGQKLFVRQNGRWLFTPFFLVVIVLETTDLVLAVDSIAAVFGVTRDPFIVYSSNVCAILGLRALYFLLAGILQYFQFLDEGLAITVMFIGAKMLADPVGAYFHGTLARDCRRHHRTFNSHLCASAKIAEETCEAKIVTRGRIVAIEVTPELIGHLADSDPAERAWTAFESVQRRLGAYARYSCRIWEQDEELLSLMVRENDAERYAGDTVRSSNSP